MLTIQRIINLFLSNHLVNRIDEYIYNGIPSYSFKEVLADEGLIIETNVPVKYSNDSTDLVDFKVNLKVRFGEALKLFNAESGEEDVITDIVLDLISIYVDDDYIKIEKTTEKRKYLIKIGFYEEIENGVRIFSRGTNRDTLDFEDITLLVKVLN